MRVDAERHWARLMAMARLGAIPGEGVNRACLTALDRQARRALIGWAEAEGGRASVDAAANLWLRFEGEDPGAAPVLTGSHMDTQPEGGRFDGIWGVLAGLAAIEAIRADGGHRRPIELVAWTNEEGGRFAPGCMGSMAWAGVRGIADFAESRDQSGTRFADALAEHLAAEADLPRRGLGPDQPGGRPVACVEAHIEQGPRLEREGIDLGLVTGIQGSRWFEVTLEGAPAHAGAAPLAGRRDAVQAMLRAVAALNALTRDPEDVLRFTVGRIAVEPNAVNTVASRATFTIDLRHPDGDVLQRVASAIPATVREAAQPCGASVAETFRSEPSRFDPAVLEALAAAADEAGLSTLRLPSGAFHDAHFVAAICPTAMLFVPCRDGVSHNPAEYSSPAQLAAGARALAGALARLAA